MLDYKKLGLRAGLEIHQQLSSGTKLFCRCPIPEKTEGSREFPIEIRRKMRPVQSELGEEDPAALFEFLRGKTFVYKANSESSCLVELDESPPLPTNEKALKTAIQIAKLLNCSLVDEIHVMRKTVIDGSAVSGFQRTALVATDGNLETSFGRVGIQTINLEEDSAPAMAKGDVVEYRLDRLGTPLVEIATDSSLGSPKEVKETAEKIGSLLRSVEVMRGIGSIRQDVNISVSEGNRAEIKGFQQLEDMEKLVENEVARQVALLEIRDELRKRGFEEIKPESRDVTKIFKNTKSGFVRRALENGQHVSALVLPKFSGLLKRQCSDRTFGGELSAYPGSYGLGIIHSDEQLEKYALATEFNELRKELRVDEEDLIAIIIGNKTEPAVSALVQRANQCLHGVPKETRVVDGIGSRYARPLPGSGRLYPESDVPAIKITKELASVELPKTIEEKINELKELPRQLAEQIVKSKYYDWFNELKKYDPVLAATIFLSTYKDLSRRGFDVNKIKFEDLDILISAVSKGKVSKNFIPDILLEVCGGARVDSVIEKYITISDDELRKTVQGIIKENPGKSDTALIGIVMEKAKGRADGRKVSQLIKELR